jgi:hypothetical protein
MPASPGSQPWTGAGGTQTQVSQSKMGSNCGHGCVKNCGLYDTRLVLTDIVRSLQHAVAILSSRKERAEMLFNRTESLPLGRSESSFV